MYNEPNNMIMYNILDDVADISGGQYNVRDDDYWCISERLQSTYITPGLNLGNEHTMYMNILLQRIMYVVVK